MAAVKFFDPRTAGEPPRLQKNLKNPAHYFFLEVVNQMNAITTKNYRNAIKRLEKANLNILDYDAVCTWVNAQNLSLSSKKLYYVALVNHFKTTNTELAEQYKSRYSGMNSILNTEAREQTLTELERKKYLPYDEICAVQDIINLSPYVSMEDKILTSFYTRMAPVRADYSRLRIYYNREPDVSENHMQIWSKVGSDSTDYVMEVFIVNHKTSASSGTLKRIIPANVKYMLHEYFTAVAFTKGLTVQEYLESKEPIYLFEFPPSEITARLQRVFLRYTGKAISVNIIRHAYITKQTEGRPPLAQLEQEAHEMGHSVLTHEMYRRLDA